MNKFDFIDWEATAAQFGHVNKKLKLTDKVVCRCVVCNLKIIYKFSGIRSRTHAGVKLPFEPKCRSCRNKAMWQDTNYRKMQTEKQSAAMKEVWKNDGYLQNIQQKMSQSSRKKWQDNDFRRKVSEGIKQTYATDKDYAQKITNHLQLKKHRDKAIAAIRSRYAADPSYKERVSEAAKRNWLDARFRERMKLATEKLISALRRMLADPVRREEWKAKLRASSLKLRQDPEFIKKAANNHKSKIEETLAGILDDLGIAYERQYPLGHWAFDFFVAKEPRNLLIEVNGDYWHNFPKNVANDTAKATYVSKYKSDTHVLKVIWEHEFLSPVKVIETVKEWFGLSTTDIKPIDFSVADVCLDIMVGKQDMAESRIFFSKYHHAANSGRIGITIGAYLNDKLIACVRFCPPIGRPASLLHIKKRRIKELTRLAIHPAYRTGQFTAWFLDKAVETMKLDKKLKCLMVAVDETFGDTNSLYESSDWAYDGATDQDYHYCDARDVAINKKTLRLFARACGMTEQSYAEKHCYREVVSKRKTRMVCWL